MNEVLLCQKLEFKTLQGFPDFFDHIPLQEKKTKRLAYNPDISLPARNLDHFYRLDNFAWSEFIIPKFNLTILMKYKVSCLIEMQNFSFLGK